MLCECALLFCAGTKLVEHEICTGENQSISQADLGSTPGSLRICALKRAWVSVLILEGRAFFESSVCKRPLVLAWIASAKTLGLAGLELTFVFDACTCLALFHSLLPLPLCLPRRFMPTLQDGSP